MAWAGMLSWLLYKPMPPLSRGTDYAASPWVKTDSGEMPPVQLTAGSDLNRAAQGPWRPLIDAGLADFKAGGSAWPRNGFRTLQIIREPANYGWRSSLANFSFRSWAFPAGDEYEPSIGMLPGPVPNPWRPMWNNLPKGEDYHMRTANPSQAKFTELIISNPNAYSLTGQPYSSSASLNATGAQQGEVLL